MLIDHKLGVINILTSVKEEAVIRGSRDGFLAEYRGFVCAVRGCYVCGAGEGRGEGNNVGAAGGGGGSEE